MNTRKLSSHELHSIDQILKDLAENSIDFSNYSFDQLRPFVHKIIELSDIYSLFALYEDSKEQAIGLALTQTSGYSTDNAYVIAFWVLDSLKESDIDKYLETEQLLLETVFSYLKENYTHIRIEISTLSTELIDFVTSQKEFILVPRADMSIDRLVIEQMPEIDFPANFSIISWDDSLLEPISKLVADYSSPTIDAQIYPFFRTPEGCRYLINNMIKEKKHAKILVHNDIPVGVCFIVVNNKIAQIPDVGLAPNFQGKGLGKKLFVYSLKELIESNPDISNVELAVSVENSPAYNLYTKLGFEDTKRINVLYWEQ